MAEKRDTPTETPLNPALKSRTDTTHDTTNVTPAPISTTSASEGEGEKWPIVWAFVTIICVAIAVYLVL
jgi:hypothetical protein